MVKIKQLGFPDVFPLKMFQMKLVSEVARICDFTVVLLKLQVFETHKIFATKKSISVC